MCRVSSEDGHAVKRSRLVGWTNGSMYRSKESISGFGRTSLENLISAAMKQAAPHTCFFFLVFFI